MTDTGSVRERTALAWQRTALALVAASAIVARLTFDRVGPLALVSVAAASVAGLWIVVGGRAPFLLAVAAVCVGAIELASVLTG